MIHKFIVFSLFPFLVFFIYTFVGASSNAAFNISNFAILTISYFGLFARDCRPYSLEKMTFIFIFFFFGIVPLNDLAENNTYWGGQNIDIFYKIVTNLVIVVGVISFVIGSRLKINFFDRIFHCLPRIKNINIVFYIVLFFICSFFIVYVNDFNIMRILMRGVVESASSESQFQASQTEMLIINNFLRPMPVILLFVLIFYYRSKAICFSPYYRFKIKSVIYLSMFLALLLSAPTSMPRFQAAALYIPWLIVFTRFWEKPLGMPATILGGLLFVMPFLDIFRRFNPNDLQYSYSLNFLNHGHFDAYQNFSRVIEVGLITYGEQLVGVFLFFVPRALWSEKPLGSGATLAHAAGYDFSNISMPLMAEGYINFGVFGVFVFMFVFGVVLGNIDRIAWALQRFGTESVFLYYYYFLFGMIFFVMRGDLMSSFAYTLGLTVAFFSVIICLKIFSSKFRF